MRCCNQRRFHQQVRFLQRQFLQEEGLPFTKILSEESVSHALTAVDVVWKDRIYSPLVTLWVFLSQVLSVDHSCRSAVARLIAHRVAKGQVACSAETGAYCQARKRLPEKFFARIARSTGRKLEASVDKKWLWKGRSVYVFDGSTVSMPDTLENQGAYPQLYNQKPGLGFPVARIAALFSLSCGAVVDFAICRYAGKGQSELGMLRTMMNVFHREDVILSDGMMCAWTEIAMLKQRGVDYVCRLNRSNRSADFRRGLRLGKDDHIVKWRKPLKPRSIDRQTYDSLPDFLSIREHRFHVEQAGFRTKTIIVVTTLLDATEYRADQLAELYRARWNAELDLRSLKSVMQMDILRCKTPELVRKELWTHILAYNLIRTIIAQAATTHGVAPRRISFKGALQSLEAFQPMIASCKAHDVALRTKLYHELLSAIAQHRVAERPNRFEPRYRKRKYKRHAELLTPRHEMKRRMLKGLN